MMYYKTIDRVARAIASMPQDVLGGPIYDVDYLAIARVAIVAMTTPESGVVKSPITSDGRAVLDGKFSQGELRSIADWIESQQAHRMMTDDS